MHLLTGSGLMLSFGLLCKPWASTGFTLGQSFPPTENSAMKSEREVTHLLGLRQKSGVIFSLSCWQTRRGPALS